MEDTLDPEHDPVAYTAQLIRGFEEMHKKTVREADEIVAMYKGGNPSCLPIALGRLDKMGLQIGEYILQTSEGQWPREVLDILGLTMKHLVQAATAVKANVKAFDFVDMTLPGIVAPERGDIH